MCDGLDRAVALGVGFEVDGPVLGKIDLPLAVRPEELARVIAAGYRDGVETEREKAVERLVHAGFGEVPGVCIDGFVAHRSSPCRRRVSRRTNPLSDIRH